MLILSRKSGESITIRPEDDSQPMHFFQEQPIKVYVQAIERGVAKLGISAHRGLNIIRDELLVKSRSVPRDVLNNSHYGNARQALAANIYTQRFIRQWTLYDLSMVAKIPMNTLTAMEHGTNRINLEDLEVLAELFDIEVSRLFRR